MIDAIRSWWRRRREPRPVVGITRLIEQCEARREAQAYRLMVGDRNFVVRVREGGQKATIVSHIPRYHWRSGDYIVLVFQSGRSTCYQVEDSRVLGGMEFINCHFAPRGAIAGRRPELVL